MLTHQQFDRARRLALSLAGIELAERHRELLERWSNFCWQLDRDYPAPSSALFDVLFFRNMLEWPARDMASAAPGSGCVNRLPQWFSL
jgi:hypothetical protein